MRFLQWFFIGVCIVGILALAANVTDRWSGPTIKH